APAPGPAEALRRCSRPLPKYEHPEVAARKKGRRYESTERSLEHHDVVVLLRQTPALLAIPTDIEPSITTRGLVPDSSATTRTLPAAMAARTATKSRCSSTRIRAERVTSASSLTPGPPPSLT